MERRHLSFSSSVELTPRQLQHTISAVRIRIRTHELPSRHMSTLGLTFSYSYVHPYAATATRRTSSVSSLTSRCMRCGAARRGGEARARAVTGDGGRGALEGRARLRPLAHRLRPAGSDGRSPRYLLLHPNSHDTLTRTLRLCLLSSLALQLPLLSH